MDSEVVETPTPEGSARCAPRSWPRVKEAGLGLPGLPALIRAPGEGGEAARPQVSLSFLFFTFFFFFFIPLAALKIEAVLQSARPA